MKRASLLIAAVSTLSVAACATNPPVQRNAGPPPGYDDGPYQDGRYANDPYRDDGYRQAPRRDGAYNNDRYGNDRGERYYDERARRYYYYDPRTGNTYWENGDLRTRG
ncbi:YajG family lipoprotein [Henriciella aquimarina]|uniref:hypothetical protein n=1 Tax=Henriciella aquimarina TaxID=545261 RepID=UPI00117A6035|nr:hypothetical protein [Henriciella aquimarina]